MKISYEQEMKKLARTFAVVSIAIVIALCGFHLILTGHPVPLIRVENLKDAAAVNHVISNRLVLVDGREVVIPHVTSLPSNSPVFIAAIERGVETTEDGQVFVLLKLHHWCGNDPVRYDLRRLNLSELVVALDPDCIEGVELTEDDKASLARLKRFDLNKYGKWGWRIGNIYNLETVRMILYKTPYER